MDIIFKALGKILNLFMGVKLYDVYKKGDQKKYNRIHGILILCAIILLFGSLFVFGILEYL